MSGVSYQIAHLLEKMTSADKDFRFMATNDLMTELQKDSIKLDDDSEKKVVRMLLKLLEDKNGEVQNLAVRCLGPLVGKVKDYQVESIVDTLCNNMVGRNEQLRDISSIGLKTVINELPLTTQSLAASVCKTMVGRLTRAIAQDECQDVSVQLEALDILGDLLSRFGGLLIQFHPSLQEALTPQLKSPRLAVRKRSVIALGHLVMSCDQALYTKLINLLLTELEGSTSTLNKRTYIQAVGAICRQAGHRFGDHVERVVPLVLEYAKEDDDELREHCLQDCENMIYKCGKEITPHIPIIMKLCLEYICYDPNYNYDETDDDENMECDEDDDDVGDDSEDEYSDDDDMSWKVRRAAAKCLEAIISTRHELLETFYLTVSPALVSRFKEREENVKADIFHAYIALLKQTKPSIIPLVNDSNSMEQEEGPVARLQAQVPNIVKVIHRQMKEKSIKTRQGCFNLLTELILVLPGALTPHIPALIPGIQFSLGDKQSSSNMKIDTVAFIQHLLTHHPPIVFHSHVAVLVPAIIASVSDPFYKISSEALLVLESLVKVIRPLKEESNFDFKCYTSPIYHCCFVKLKASDIDQEVKERAISCMGQILAHLGDHLRNELPSCLPIFAERLNNEITRLTAVKALTKIANSPLRIDISPILSNSLPTLASFLRKNQRALKLSALTLLDTVVRNYSTSINATNLSTVLVELHPLLTESDLHIAQLTLHFLTSVAKLQKDSLPSIYDTSLMEIFKLAQSPLLQGAALVAMLDFLKALVAADLPGLGERDLLMKLILPVMKPSGSSIHKQGRASIAKCVAALVVTNPETAQTVVKDFSENLKEQSDNYHKQTFSLLAIGEIGNYIDLSKNAELKNIVLKSFNHSSEEVKSAASYALGKLSLGNLKEYLPFVLQEIESQPKRQYLLLHSLKEIISVQSTSSDGVQILAPYVPAIWDQLFKHCECNEEGTRNVVAECLGKLCLIDPEKLLPRLKSALDSPSPLMRTTVVTAMKFTISDQPQPIDNLLRNNIGDFLRCLEDSDLNVRRVALVAFNSAAHNKPSLIRDLLKTFLPQLYNETQKRKELIREVEMGPFKHEVDDGLDLRKAAFECMYTLLDNCVDRLDIFEFLSHVQDGLKDHYDIKMLTYLMVARVAELCPAAVLQKLDKLVDPLKTTVTTKVKANSVKQEYEKQDELKRSAMRAVAALMGIPGANKHPILNEFITQIRNTPDLANLFDSIQKDNSGESGTSFAMDMS
ncbi:cullin-associated NEDD8-dissociated protein 1 [Lepeophtheirus salmonis]|uniref:TATA-binding protein interacting (TIP20) domain-containing protein n=1 Tax=Lepeophtheirus salmonis TaxID=72036 RepID=A0A0K2TFK9_LEPSM|nr:cullin-associated NEDD8-dissociated protein 1-like [Lepeophtheirus salmonis]